MNNCLKIFKSIKHKLENKFLRVALTQKIISEAVRCLLKKYYHIITLKGDRKKSARAIQSTSSTLFNLMQQFS